MIIFVKFILIIYYKKIYLLYYYLVNLYKLIKRTLDKNGDYGIILEQTIVRQRSFFFDACRTGPQMSMLAKIQLSLTLDAPVKPADGQSRCIYYQSFNQTTLDTFVFAGDISLVLNKALQSTLVGNGRGSLVWATMSHDDVAPFWPFMSNDTKS
jgi:hypothetical protein